MVTLLRRAQILKDPLRRQSLIHLLRDHLPPRPGGAGRRRGLCRTGLGLQFVGAVICGIACGKAGGALAGFESAASFFPPDASPLLAAFCSVIGSNGAEKPVALAGFESACARNH